MKFDWLGIFTFGNVCAFISSFSPMIPFRLSRYAVTRQGFGLGHR